MLCNGGSQAYCSNALLLNALIRKPVQNEAELFSAKGMYVTYQVDVLSWTDYETPPQELCTQSDLQQNEKIL